MLKPPRPRREGEQPIPPRRLYHRRGPRHAFDRPTCPRAQPRARRGLALLVLASCARPGHAVCPPRPRYLRPHQQSLSPPLRLPARPPRCSPQGAAIYPLSRIAGCEGLIKVEHRTAMLLVPAATLLAAGLSAQDLAALPEEVR